MIIGLKKELQQLERQFYGHVLESMSEDIEPDTLCKWDDQACREAEDACEEYARAWNDAAGNEAETITRRLGRPDDQPIEDEILLKEMSWQRAKRIDDGWVRMDQVDIRNLKRMLGGRHNHATM